MGNVMETITSTVGQRNQELQESERNQDSEERENTTESEESMNIHISTSSEVYQSIDSNLNINSSGGAPEGQEDKILNHEIKELLSKASMVYNTVVETPGDFANRRLDSRVKEKPTKTNIENINTVIEKLVHQHLGQSNLTLDPFWTLWIITCILYKAVSALLLI